MMKFFIKYEDIQIINETAVSITQGCNYKLTVLQKLIVSEKRESQEK